MIPLLGRPLALEDRAEIARMREAEGSLDLICVGDFNIPESSAYFDQIAKLGKILKTPVFRIDLNSCGDLADAIAKLAVPPENRSFLFLRPFDRRFASYATAIDPSQDPDRYSLRASADLYEGKIAFLPATARAALRLIRSVLPDLKGKRALVIGRSVSVGLPIFHALMREGAFCSLAHSQVAPTDIADCARSSDIVVLASGKQGLISPADLREGQVIIDCGFHPDGQGDLGFIPPVELSGYYTPVPGGVGPLTVVSLFHNAYALRKVNHGC